VSGGAGDDGLLGGRGDDSLIGGAGDDTFVFRRLTDGADTIADWGDGQDRLDIGALLAAAGLGAEDVVLDGWSTPGATVLRIGSTGVSITLTGATAAELDLSALAETGVIRSVAVAAGGDGPLVLDRVPAYEWYHGCAPTAVASIFGYWDLHGHPKYFDAQGWDALRWTAAVQDEISSPEHNAKYDPTPDDPPLTDPADTSIADFLRTSEGSVTFGWTWLASVDSGIEGYAELRGAPVDARTAPVAAVAWEDVVAEIDAARPMLFLVDTGGDGATDHFVPVLGYDDRGPEGGRWYGAYTTWTEAETVEWFEWRPMAAGEEWGVAHVTFVQPLGADAIVA